MGKTRACYAAEFRALNVELVRSGRTPDELAREFEPTALSISNWVGQFEREVEIHREAAHATPPMNERGRRQEGPAQPSREAG